MVKCKNVECSKETKKGRVYCSLTCRNVYVNKYLRDYKKQGNKKKEKNISEYKKNPKHCGNLNCNVKLPYEKRGNTYCGNSCSAKVKNGTRKLPKKYNMSKEGLEAIKKANRERNGDLIGEYEKNPNKCTNCNEPLKYAHRKRTYCTLECKREYERKNQDEYRQYQLNCKFKFGLKEYPNEFNFGLIEEHGWYSPSNSTKPNIKGVSRDHIFSVSEGFKQNINPNIISHPANCRLMIHSNNIGKGGDCDITIEELKTKIQEWDKKYPH
jgi:hypothetical protein